MDKHKAEELVSKVRRYFKDDIILSSKYPWDLMFVHCISGISSYKSWVEQILEERKTVSGEEYSLSVFHHMVGSYFLFTFGGSSFRDTVLSEKISLLTNSELPKAFLIAFGTVFYSPVYKLATTPRTITSLTVTTFEAIDSATTLFGSVEKGRRLFPESSAAPFVASMAAGLGGSILRYFAKKHLLGVDSGDDDLVIAPSAFRRVFLYTILYMVLSKQNGLQKARLWLTTFHVCWCLLKEISGRPLDFTRIFA